MTPPISAHTPGCQRRRGAAAPPLSHDDVKTLTFHQFLNLWFAKPMVGMLAAFHKNNRNDENDEDNLDSYKQGVEIGHTFWGGVLGGAGGFRSIRVRKLGQSC